MSSNGIKKLLDIVLPVGIYHFFGIEWVVVYATIDIDIHLDEIVELIKSKVVKKK